MTTPHTYTIHLTVGANDDRHAAQIAQHVTALLLDDPAVPEAHGYRVLAAFVTDADDWAEHVDVGGENVCTCGQDAQDRTRSGRGSRVCASCATSHPYPIVDEEI